jgi:hypothetical protein
MAEQATTAGASPDTPGNETSEHDTMNKAKLWIRMSAGVVFLVASTFLAAGIVPPDSSWVTFLTMIVALVGGIGGEVVNTKTFTQSRTAIKVAKVAAAAREGGMANPPQT